MNIILVDDEELELLLLDKLIRRSDISFEKIYKASCMEEAVEILENHMVNIMICDIEMPGGSGFQLTEWVRNRKLDIEVIFLTGHAKFSYATDAIRLEVKDYLLKPVKEEDLKNAILRVLSKQSDTMTNQYSVENSKMLILKAQDYIKEHCDEDLTREKVAKKFFFQPNYFSNMFSKVTKMSFREYLNLCRMEKAKKLLLYSNKSISQIAVETGYSTTAYFIKQFKEKYGITPKKYRSQERDSAYGIF